MKDETNKLNTLPPGLKHLRSELDRHVKMLEEARLQEPKLAATADISEPTTFKALSDVRMWIQILPDKIRQYQAAIVALEEQLNGVIEKNLSELRASARERLELLRAKEEKHLGLICGHDPLRTRAALTAVVESSELAARWLGELNTLDVFGRLPEDRAAKFVKVRDGFENGLTLSQAFAS